MLKKLSFLLIMFFLFSSSFSACTYEGSGTYTCKFSSGPQTFDTYTCYDYTDDIFGCCFWGSDNLPALSGNDPFYPYDYEGHSYNDCEDIDSGTSSTVYLYLKSIDDAPDCGTKGGGSLSDAGSGSCQFGYLNCFSATQVSDNMGCETNCNECFNDGECGIDDNNYYYKCEVIGNCNLCAEYERSCRLSISDNYCPSGCYYDTDIDCTTCPSGTKSVPGQRSCVTPFCNNDGDCNGDTCVNPGQYNAFCSVNIDDGTGLNILSIANNIQVENEFYDFVIFERIGEERNLLNIYESGNYTNSVVSRKVSGEYFNLRSKTYRVFFSAGVNDEDNSLSVFEVSFFTRLTYNIFPVCGNSICETCESEDNCLHYPPESCMSCPTDCPYITDEELNSFNEIRVSYDLNPVDFGDLLIDNDLSCQSKTMDFSSTCNPLCITHEFIDSNGCLFNRYRNALPQASNVMYDPYCDVDLNERTYSDSCTEVSYVGETDYNQLFIIKQGAGYEERAISFNEKDYNVVYYQDGFFGEVGRNSLCQSSCECVSGYCSKESIVEYNDEDYGHCCPVGYQWSDTDNNANVYCSNGRLLSEYRDAFVDNNDNDYIDSTEGVKKNSNGEYVIDYDGARKVSDFICNNDSDDHPICEQGIDPICAYIIDEENYEAIQPNGVYQCRKEKTITETVVPEFKCTIHSHALAYAECEDESEWDCVLNWGQDNPFQIAFCVTDNSDECSGTECVSGLVRGEVVLRTITYEDYCKTPDLLCENYNSRFTNNVDGSYLYYVDCPQDGMARVTPTYYDNDIWMGEVHDTYEYYLFNSFNDKLLYNNYGLISIGDYCGTFGNDFERILNVDSGISFKYYDESPTSGAEWINVEEYEDSMGKYNFATYGEDPAQFSLDKILSNGEDYLTTINTEESDFIIEVDGEYYVKISHLPSVDRDAEERLYAYLWSREGCIEVFGEENVASCDNNRYYVRTVNNLNIDNAERINNQGGYYYEDSNQYNLEKSFKQYDNPSFCNAFWKDFEEKYPGEIFDWHYNGYSLDDNNDIDVLTVNDYINVGDKINGENIVETWRYRLDDRVTAPIIELACIKYYQPYLDEYYSNAQLNYYYDTILPSWVNYYRYTIEPVRSNGDCVDGLLVGDKSSNEYPNVNIGDCNR